MLESDYKRLRVVAPNGRLESWHPTSSSRWRAPSSPPATLFGARISTAVAERAFRVLDENGITRDLEAALVRLTLRHRRLEDCPGGRACIAVGGIDSTTPTVGPTALPAPPRRRAASKLPIQR